MGDDATVVDGEVRFLHLIERRPADDQAAAWECWQETIERRVPLREYRIDKVASEPRPQAFEFPGQRWQIRDVAGDDAHAEADVVRRQEPIRGTIEMAATCMSQGVALLSVSVINESPCEVPEVSDAEGASAQLQSLASAHVILRVRGGQFVSRIDPPDAYHELCQNDPGDALWPILVGETALRDTLLCSPIILYDYPELAPESPGDFFDATEIDEMLTLRIMTLSDDEKRAIASLDERGRALLERTRNMAESQMAKLHGATRSMRVIQESTDGY